MSHAHGPRVVMSAAHRRTQLWSASVGIIVLGLLSFMPASANAAPVGFDIPAQDLTTALIAFSNQAHIEVTVAPDLAQGLRAPKVSGTMEPAEALRQLIGSHLSYEFIGTDTVVIRRAERASSLQKPVRADPAVEAPTEEIIVTAQKREERLQDVPAPVSVLDSQVFAQTGQTLLRDYASTVPGLSLSPNYSADQTLSIRGIATGGFSNPTVGVLIDGVQFGGSTDTSIPDLDPGDLARIEVLRGPQGTLYGASGLGGLINYVTIDPSTSGLSGRFSAGTEQIHNGAEPGFNVRGAVNIPASDTLAVRISAFDRLDAGYIDNPVRNANGVNEAKAYGGRLAVLWRPSDDFSVKLNGLFQRTIQSGSSEVDVQPGLGDLQQNYIPGVGGYDRTVQSYNAVIKAKVAGIDITSTTNYNKNKIFDSLDYSVYLGGATKALPQFNASGAPYYDSIDQHKISEEMRLSSSFGTKVDWLAGAFFTHEHLVQYGEFAAADAATGKVLGVTLLFNTPGRSYDEYAAFADLTYHFSDRFDVQLGGRESHINITQDQSSVTGPFTTIFYNTPNPVITPPESSSSDTFTYLITPRFKITPDTMIYARLASGYRPGGPNATVPGAPSEYRPDSTQNYEIGVKAKLLDGRLSLDASLYRIDWKDIQLQLRSSTNIVYQGNGSEAKSEGVEASFDARPLEGLSVSGWLSYDNAVLTKSFGNSPNYGAVGNRLPFTPAVSAWLAAEQRFPLPGALTGMVGGSVNYVGQRLGIFQTTAVRAIFPEYTQIDVHAGIKYEGWDAKLYVNNVTDKRGILNGGVGYLYSYAFIYTQPRTVGVSISKSF